VNPRDLRRDAPAALAVALLYLFVLTRGQWPPPWIPS
jgi:hypothetical protein